MVRRAEPVRISSLYPVVRALQLEGNWPNEGGVCPITAQRVGVGWGAIPKECWPERRGDPWPPAEPPGLDAIAKRRRTGFYQRVRSSNDAQVALTRGHPVMCSIRIAASWMDVGADGLVPLPAPGEMFLGNHSMVLAGHADGRFTVWNSYGTEWGDRGFGYLPFAYFDRFLNDAFCVEPSSQPHAKDIIWVAPAPLGNEMFGTELWDAENDERQAWAYATPRDGFLDIEELFVRPQYRRQGLATDLVRELRRAASEARLPLRAWIPWPDVKRENMPGVRAVLRRLNLEMGPSPFPWARYVATPPGQRTLLHR